MNTTDTATGGKRIVIAIEADRLASLGLSEPPAPGEEFVLTGRVRARDTYPAGQDGPGEATFELVPQRMEAASAASGSGYSLRGASARDNAAQANSPRGSRRAEDPEEAQKRREAFFRSLFREDD